MGARRRKLRSKALREILSIEDKLRAVDRAFDLLSDGVTEMDDAIGDLQGAIDLIREEREAAEEEDLETS